MSHDFSLNDPVTKQCIELDFVHQITGGTYAVGGTKQAELNITYNYGVHFRRVIDEDKGIRAIVGMTGAESIPILKSAIEKLGDDADPDYWKPTEGNAKRALHGLLAFAQLRPDGVWDAH